MVSWAYTIHDKLKAVCISHIHIYICVYIYIYSLGARVILSRDAGLGDSLGDGG